MSASVFDLPHCSLEQIPPPAQGHVHALLEQGAPPPGLPLLCVAGSQAELRRSYLVAASLSWLLLLGGLAAGVAVGVTVSWVSGAIIGTLFGGCGALAVWLWAGSRRALARDRFWELGIATPNLLVIRAAGTFRCVPLDGFSRAEAQIRTVNGAVADVALVLLAPGEELRWFGLELFGVASVEQFANTLNGWLQAPPATGTAPQGDPLEATLRRIASQGAGPAVWLSKGIHEGMRGATWVEVCSDGTVRVRRYDPVGGEQTIVAQTQVSGTEVATLANTLLQAQLNALAAEPAPPPSLAGEWTLEISWADESFSLQRPLHEAGSPSLAPINAAFQALAARTAS